MCKSRDILYILLTKMKNQSSFRVDALWNNVLYRKKFVLILFYFEYRYKLKFIYNSL